MKSKFLFSAALGFLVHKLTYERSLLFGDKWGMFLRYAIGSLSLIPAKAIIKPRDEVSVSISTEFLALLTFGAGVLIGHIVDIE